LKKFYTLPTFPIWPEKALAYINKLKDSGAREVIVLHVIDQRGMERLHRFMGDERFEALKKHREEEDTSAIVIGSHGMSHLQELFLGSVSEKANGRSIKPVFVIKR